jgi:hypothetical protein
MSTPATVDDGVVEVRLREVNQLFDVLDPAPFHEKELNRSAEEYLVESAKELPSGAVREIVLYLEGLALADDQAAVGDAIRAHFGRRSTVLRRSLRQLLQRGIISLVIGLTFLTAMFALSQVLVNLLGGHSVTRVLREGLLIIGWVAMWKPLEILLYDWWPILAERLLCDRLSRVQVRVAVKKAR